MTLSRAIRRGEGRRHFESGGKPACGGGGGHSGRTSHWQTDAFGEVDCKRCLAILNRKNLKQKEHSETLLPH
jgi:hypothetical protein